MTRTKTTAFKQKAQKEYRCYRCAAKIEFIRLRGSKKSIPVEPNSRGSYIPLPDTDPMAEEFVMPDGRFNTGKRIPGDGLTGYRPHQC